MAFFSKGVNLCFWRKNANFFFYLHLVKIRLEILLSDLADKTETSFTIYIYKKEFFKVQKRVDQKMPNSFLFRFGQNKTRNNA